MTETLIVTYRYADGSESTKGYAGDFAEAVFTARDKKDAGEIVSFSVSRQKFHDEVIA